MITVLHLSQTGETECIWPVLNLSHTHSTRDNINEPTQSSTYGMNPQTSRTFRQLINKTLYTWLPRPCAGELLGVSLAHLSSNPPPEPKPERVHRFPRPLLSTVSFSFQFRDRQTERMDDRRYVCYPPSGPVLISPPIAKPPLSPYSSFSPC
jgi:hypothetical protein